MKKLMIEISYCKEVKNAMENSNHPCHKIVMSQQKELKDFQHPEPWNGNIEKADILFIGLNPSYNPIENYPTSSWTDNDIYIFHKNRFSDSYYQANKNKVMYWQKMRKSAYWLLKNISLDDSELENHICLTEIVHCKSKKQEGVSKACNMCIEMWLDKVLKEFNGKYIVVFGKKAEEVFKNYEAKKTNISKGKEIIYVPHPSRWRWIGKDEKIRKTFFN